MEETSRRNRRRQGATMLLGVFALLAALVSAAPSQGAEIEGTPQATPVGRLLTVADIVAAMRAAGLSVEETGETIRHDFFAVPAQLYRVEGQDLQLFVYPSEAARAADLAKVAPDGYHIGTSIVDWIAPPHFTAAGNVITLLLTRDEVLARTVADVVASLASPTTPTASPGVSPVPSPTTEADVTGWVTRVEAGNGDLLGTILVEEVLDVESGDKAMVTITVETALLRRQGGALVPVGFGDLSEGQWVETWFTGPVAESYPVQATAATVVVAGAP